MASSSDRSPRAFRRLLAVLVVLGGMVAATLAEGSVLRAFTVPELRSGAEAIVSGTVVGVRAVEADGTIETVARVRVRESWRGTTRRTIRVRVPGGQAAGRRLVVPGSPALERGDELLLFLYADGAEWRPVGLFQGVWHLDPERPEMARASASGGAALVRTVESAGPIAVDLPERTVAQLVGGVR